ncbi:MAG: hypothetical protein HY248_02380 [Fimbriimonas ginsengisoli]|nr:hypothetical protein [Fimbriimonas ginsengisoli]
MLSRRFQLLCATTLAGLLLSSASVASAVSLAGDQALREGLKLWRKPGAINDHAACANCHSPDGIEIAAYGFSDETIRRRAAPHLSMSDSNGVVHFIHSVRAKYGIKRLLDPMEDRVFQPGGRVLPGKAPLDRDGALAQGLAPLVPTLSKGRIGSLADALRAKNELLKIDLWSLRIGLEFNRLSEDGFHGKEHASIANWFADTPRVPREASSAAWYGLHDRYLADPTDANFWALYNRVVDLTKGNLFIPGELLSFEKYRALLLGQHLMRRALLGKPPRRGPVALAGTVSQRLIPNPMWSVGDFARQYEDADFGVLQFPKEVLAKKSLGPPAAEQLKTMRAPWLWLGWMMDQGLQRINNERATKRGEYVMNALWNDGPYPVHNIFMASRAELVHCFVPEAWGSGFQRHFVLGYGAFRRSGFYVSMEPKSPEHRRLYRTIVANAFRMSTYLLLEDVRRLGAIWGAEVQVK